MLRLFVVAGFTFESKSKAKKFRDDLNELQHATFDGRLYVLREGPKVHISFGPDHPKYRWKKCETNRRK